MVIALPAPDSRMVAEKPVLVKNTDYIDGKSNGHSNVHHNGDSNGHGSHGNGTIVLHGKPAPVMPRIPPPRLVEPDTIAALADRFSLDNFINKHEIHQRELTKIDDIDTTMIRDDRFFSTVTNIDFKHVHHWGVVMKARDNISSHLQVAIAESDKLLETLTKVIEKLDIAEHDRAVAFAKFEAAEKRRMEIEHQLKIANCELGSARFRMIELAEERDDMIAKAEVSQKVLHIRDKQLSALQTEVSDLQTKVINLTALLAAAVEGARDARHELNLAKMEIQVMRQKIDALNKTNEELSETNVDITRKLTELSLKFADVSRDNKGKTKLLDEAEKELARLVSINEKLQERLKVADEHSTTLKIALKEALKDRQQAVDREEVAIKNLKDSERARDEAIRNELEFRTRYSSLHIIWEDTDSTLKQVSQERDDMMEERDRARERAFAACHQVQESIEWGQALNFINHQLLGEWEIMKTEKITAVKAKLEAEKEKFVVRGQRDTDRETIIQLQAQLDELLDGHRTLEMDCVFQASQFQQTREKLEAQLSDKADQLDGAQISQLGWDKEKAELNKTLQGEKGELAKATARIAELEASHTSSETVLKQDIQKLSQTIKELEEGRDSHAQEIQKQSEEKLRIAKQEIEISFKETELGLKKNLEQSKLGFEAEQIYIQGIYYAGQRLEDNKQLDDVKRKEIYTRVGGAFGSSEAFHVDQFFPENLKKKQVVVLYRLKKGDESSRILTASEGSVKFPSKK
ncbi:uncharacterized protein N7483_004109 [Penicillium malachiteum]|uniref:uncharacterized protein n=1 Tax=Penicillium malachiteum TaxID=1324776 RepID=UPI002548BF3B|nr:uncharacterized protein N7483_004109 [Penicillium malachiteum]KAJ5729601.1 hypothetical protein N7483_004109 [Penicillium malachiteum]